MRAASRGEMPKNLASNWSTVLEESAPPDAVGVRVPALWRDVADSVAAFGEQSPECCRIVGAGETAADADDGDRLVGAQRPRIGLVDLRVPSAMPSVR